ncbi:MAG: aminotransferase class I/II-fold pyridoxal phosphate-dependent enzyme [Patescibacteria group bacterium]
MITDFYNNLAESAKGGKTPYVITSGQGAYLTIDGKKKLNFCSSHYLGLAVNERIRKAAKRAIDQYGIGTGYRTLAGTHSLHVQLEEAIARFKHAEAAIVLTGGYMTNCAAIQTIIGKEDIVISDELNHASIIDAIRLSQVKNKFIYKHKDVRELEDRLKEAVKLQKTILIVTDGVFSMDGDLAPLPQIVTLAKKYHALTMVDDAHGEGVLGKGGRGIVDHFNLHGQIDIEVGTLSKAFGVMGGFITGKKVLIDFYKQKSRQFLFSNALTIPDTAAALEGVKILEESDELVKTLWNNTNYLKKEFKKLGFDTGQSQTPITPIMMPDEGLARLFSAKLFALDVFATPIVFPMVAKDKARIRVIPSASHKKKDLNFGIQMFERIGKELKVI